MVSVGAVTRLIVAAGITATMMISTASNSRANNSDPRTAMIEALSATGPHPSLGREARVFDRFIGTWDCDYGFYRDDGTKRHVKGELEFGWILDGRAIQDIWISYPTEPGKERGIGTTVRFFDARLKTWRVIFVGPSYGALIEMKGGEEGDRIVLRGVDDEGSMLRWTFNDITANAFVWRGEKSRDRGKTWKLEEEHHMTRRMGSRGTGSSSEHAHDPRLDMIRMLGSSSASPSLGSEAQLFDRFVGAWDLDCTFYDSKGNTSRLVGEWRFGWALDGKIEQDVIVEHHGNERIARGTTLRFFDIKARKWRIVWIAPSSGNVAKLTGGAVDDRIVLEGVDADGSPFRWSFNDIGPNCFLWKGETSENRGQDWRLEQEMHLARQTPAAVVAGNTAPKPNSVLAFERLSALVGEWGGTENASEAKLIYRLTSDGSALMEDFQASKDEMITMFTVDGDHLIATHYCSVGNQPQMVTEPIKDSSSSLVFSLSRVTGMKTPDDWHNTGLTVTLEDNQHLTQVWTYEYKGQKGTNTFRFVRTK